MEDCWDKTMGYDVLQKLSYCLEVMGSWGKRVDENFHETFKNVRNNWKI